MSSLPQNSFKKCLVEQKVQSEKSFSQYGLYVNISIKNLGNTYNLRDVIFSKIEWILKHSLNLLQMQCEKVFPTKLSNYHKVFWIMTEGATRGVL